ncbi:hypothetical protein DIE12_31790 [Burkholderia sp. Bp9015]|nr:hypothetical protein DIE12_31790 [Burkholderia sp. Bp9015]
MHKLNACRFTSDEPRVERLMIRPRHRRWLRRIRVVGWLLRLISLSHLLGHAIGWLIHHLPT